MHPAFHQALLNDSIRTAEQGGRTAYLRRPNEHRVVDRPLALRLCTVGDDPALEALALLEGRQVPLGRLIIAEVSGEIVAALPLSGGRPLADPFRPTADILPLLRLRAEQLAAIGEPKAGHRRIRFVISRS